MRCPRASCQRAVAHRRFAARAEGAGTPELASGMSETFLTLLCFWRGARVRALRCAEGARQRAAFLVLKAFPKGKACFQLKPRRRISAPPPFSSSVLVATRKTFDPLLPTSSCGRGVAVHDSSNTKDIAAPRTSSQRLTLRTSRLSSADPQPASYNFRPTLAPTYALIARCRKFHSLVRRATFRAHSSIFRAFVSESRRALATRGRVGSAV